jgi:hypothetical protein
MNTIYHLAEIGPGATWKLLNQRLQTAREFHVTVMIPDEITSCHPGTYIPKVTNIGLQIFLTFFIFTFNQ